MKSNSDDVLLHFGRVINDNFFDENLLDENIAGAVTSAPSNLAERRTFGQSENYETTFTELTDFDPVNYIGDAGLALYPVILTALGYSDSGVEDGTIGMFESRSEIVGFRYVTPFAKKGLKAAVCSAAEGADRLSYFVEQQIMRKESGENGKNTKYVETKVADLAVDYSTYQDQDPSSISPFIDDYDSSVSYGKDLSSLSDSEISNVLRLSSASCVLLSRDKVSASAGWTFLNKTNGTDSIVYSDRM